MKKMLKRKPRITDGIAAYSHGPCGACVTTCTCPSVPNNEYETMRKAAYNSKLPAATAAASY